ncbi:LAQU0S21e00320g1_1 [Lachancea quebecensis]|uniref:LAQU0S21e00320g1_1 n=1 Tax=Lachancea quebecensis TaxID=1654605 RepID=A0A0P1KXC6_9SACH|nr:LAQU0S21e00320g1_1 [Lachancea quebecensis]
MSRRIVCVEEFSKQYEVPEEVSRRFLPRNDVCVVSEDEFEKVRLTRKREAESQLSTVMLKKASCGGWSAERPAETHEDYTLNSEAPEGAGRSLTLELDSFQLLDSDGDAEAESSMVLFTSSRIEYDSDTGVLLQSGDFASEPDTSMRAESTSDTP